MKDCSLGTWVVVVDGAFGGKTGRVTKRWEASGTEYADILLDSPIIRVRHEKDGEVREVYIKRKMFALSKLERATLKNSRDVVSQPSDEATT